MFTLKIAQTGTDPASTTWIADVAKVHLCKIGKKGEDSIKWSEYSKDTHVEDFTEALPEGRDIALLTVVHTDGHDYYVICGRAWLLNGDGKIVERITP